MKYAIETIDLTKKYKDFLAVNGLNLKVDNKSIFGFLGPNGAGKTTTIKMLTCLIQPTSGTAEVAGYDIKKSPNEVRQKIGMVPQLVSLYKDLTARENVELCADYYGMSEDLKETRIDELLELVDIKYAENKQIGQMSGGQKQKVSVAASLIHRPDILFLDEPTIGLDPTTKRILWDLIEELHENGHTIILCSHDMYEVEKLCDTVGIMNQGQLAAFDTPQELKDQAIDQKKCGSNVNNILKELENGTTLNKDPSFEKLKNVIEKDRIEQENVDSKEISIMMSNLDEKLIDTIRSLPYVLKVTKDHSERITVSIYNADNSINKLIATIIENNGKITSIHTKDPSLEDVFMAVTSKKNKGVE